MNTTDIDPVYLKSLIQWLSDISSIELNEESHDEWFENATKTKQFEICDYLLYEIEECFEQLYIASLTKELQGVNIASASTSTSTNTLISIHPVVQKDTINLSITEQINELCSAEQIEQRTPAWYTQALFILTASEIGTLFGNQKVARAKLVEAKCASEPPIRNQQLAVRSIYMSPFDWGIRFEPVVKQIYEYINKGAKIFELGRLVSKQHIHCGASPDGIIFHKNSDKHGYLIEIKCPVSRIPNEKKIPKEYYHQMQMQMFVAQRPACQFVEAVFSSPYKSGYAPKNNEGERFSPGGMNGTIALLYVKNTGKYIYRYSEINSEIPSTSLWYLEGNETSIDFELIELIPWSLTEWIEQTVKYDPMWWKEAEPLVDKFWKDVQLKRQYQEQQGEQGGEQQGEHKQLNINNNNKGLKGTGAKSISSIGFSLIKME